MINDNKQYPPPDYGPGHHGGGPGSVASGHPHSPPPPPQTSITLNTDPTPGARVTEINLNIGYFKTLPGILKLVQLVSFVNKIFFFHLTLRKFWHRKENFRSQFLCHLCLYRCHDSKNFILVFFSFGRDLLK